MADITGVAITDVTQYGSAENGLKVWVKYKLADGTEHIFIYPYEMVGHLIELLRKAANDSYSMRIARNPEAAQEGVISGVVPLKEIQVAASPEHDGPILQMLTADNIPVAFEAPWPLIESFSHQLPEALENMKKPLRRYPAEGRCIEGVRRRWLALMCHFQKIGRRAAVFMCQNTPTTG